MSEDTEKFDKIESKLESLAEKISGLETKVTSLNYAIDKVESLHVNHRATCPAPSLDNEIQDTTKRIYEIELTLRDINNAFKDIKSQLDNISIELRGLKNVDLKLQQNFEAHARFNKEIDGLKLQIHTSQLDMKDQDKMIQTIIMPPIRDVDVLKSQLNVSFSDIRDIRKKLEEDITPQTIWVKRWKDNQIKIITVVVPIIAATLGAIIKIAWDFYTKFNLHILGNK